MRKWGGLRVLRLLAAALVGAALATLAFAQTATVVDGDTIKLNGITYRLWGIDAPERDQWCGDYRAGALAVAALAVLVRGSAVVCESKTTDRYGRVVAICRADGDDLGLSMVEVGMALAFTRYSRDYVSVEAWARDRNIGVHAMKCEPPWEWRARARAKK
ncbi:MAG: thermonuclease family protein [Alphaproteobacteria bacterium]